MFERFTGEARAVVVQAQEHARRLGHHYLGCEHLLLALASAEQPAGAVLRDHGVTPQSIEAVIFHRVGLGAGATVLGGLDRDALASIGIDLDAVRAKVEAAFGPDALAKALPPPRPGEHRSRLNPGRAIPPGLRHLRRRRARALVAATRMHVAPATGLYEVPSQERPTGHIPFTPRAKKALQLTLREALARDDHYIGVEHIALAVVSMKDGLVPNVLGELGASAPTLRTAIEDRYRQAS